MEYCGCGDLAQKVERYKRRRQYIDENVIWRYLVQCLKALQHLHEKNICHRDLKVPTHSPTHSTTHSPTHSPQGRKHILR